MSAPGANWAKGETQWPTAVPLASICFTIAGARCVLMEDDLPPRRAQHDLHRFRIEPKIKLAADYLQTQVLSVCRFRWSLGILVVCINTPTSVGWLPNTAYS